MKKKIIIAALFVVATITSYLLGTTQSNTIVKTVTETATTPDEYINMDDVTDFEVTENGLMLHLDDGSGYYWER